MQRAEGDLLNRLTRALDRGQRYLRDIREFSTDADCIYRLSIGCAARDRRLPDGTVLRRGDPIGVLHLWGDHMPVIPPSGVNLAWGKKVTEVLRKSTRLLAQHVLENPDLTSLPAYGNDAFFIYGKTTVRLMERMGFAVLKDAPGENLQQRVRLRVLRLWTWLLRRAFNQESVRGIRPRDLQYRSVWLSRRTLVERYS